MNVNGGLQIGWLICPPGVTFSQGRGAEFAAGSFLYFKGRGSSLASHSPGSYIPLGTKVEVGLST